MEKFRGGRSYKGTYHQEDSPSKKTLQDIQCAGNEEKKEETTRGRGQKKGRRVKSKSQTLNGSRLVTEETERPSSPMEGRAAEGFPQTRMKNLKGRWPAHHGGIMLKDEEVPDKGERNIAESLAGNLASIRVGLTQHGRRRKLREPGDKGRRVAGHSSCATGYGANTFAHRL